MEQVNSLVSILNGTNTTGSNCTYYDESGDGVAFTIVAGIRALIGLFSALCCLLVIGMIFCLKKYSFYSQRLILYLAIAAFLHSLSYTLARVNYYTPRYLFDDYCYFGGFINLYSSWAEVLALCCLTFNVFVNAVMDRWPSTSLQYVYLAVMFLGPLLWCWVPFLNQTYASSLGWCDLRTVDEQCNRFVFGDILRFALWYVPVYILLFVCFLAIVVAAIMIHRRSRMWYGIYNPDYQQTGWRLKNEVKPLIWYPVVYLLLNVFSLANRIDIAIHSPEDSTIALWYLHVLTSPLRGAFIAIVYAFDPEVRKRITCACLCALCCYRSSRPNIIEYDIIHSSSGESPRESDN